MHYKKTLCSALLAISLLLAACGRSRSGDTPTPEPQAVLTAAAQTAQAKMTELAAQNPSPLPPTPTQTSAPTTPTVTPTRGTAAATTAAQPVAGGGADRVEYVADLTVPDGTVFRPGEKFTKSWRLMNAGTSTWTTAYSLVFFSGEQMGGPASTPLSAQVPPGQTLDVSAALTAPSREGNYTGYWLLRNAAGTNFGMGANSDGAFYVQINVSGTATGTPGTATADDDTPTAATLSVDAADVVGTCPHSFNFTGTITIGEAATVTYVLEVEADIPLTLPGPTTTDLGAGTSQVSYTLELSNSATGSVTLHVTSPEDVRSPTIGFTLTCQ